MKYTHTFNCQALYRSVRAVALLPVILFLAGCATKEYVNEGVVITDNYSFTENVAKTKFSVNRPGVVIEGNDYVVDGNCNTNCIGLSINANNVTVRNLTIMRFDGGVSIKPNVTGTRFENVRVLDNVNHGIFVNVGVNGFSCNNCDISNNGTMGIYLEYNSYGNTIENSRITNNGYRDKDTGDWKENLKNESKDKREGLAIDSSQNNMIRNTVFEGNALTGVTLYRNCGERGVIREWGANYNSIIDSTFSDGIHIASRQDKDLSDWVCEQPYIHADKYITDEAEYNWIERVSLKNNASIVVQDDNNTIRSVTGGRIIFGSSVRDAISQPITTITTENNSTQVFKLPDDSRSVSNDIAYAGSTQ